MHSNLGHSTILFWLRTRLGIKATSCFHVQFALRLHAQVDIVSTPLPMSIAVEINSILSKYCIGACGAYTIFVLRRHHIACAIVMKLIKYLLNNSNLQNKIKNKCLLSVVRMYHPLATSHKIKHKLDGTSLEAFLHAFLNPIIESNS